MYKGESMMESYTDKEHEDYWGDAKHEPVNEAWFKFITEIMPKSLTDEDEDND